MEGFLFADFSFPFRQTLTEIAEGVGGGELRIVSRVGWLIHGAVSRRLFIGAR